MEKTTIAVLLIAVFSKNTLTFMVGYDRYSLCVCRGVSVNTAVIILFHGSRAEGAGDGVQRILANIRQRGEYDVVAEAFLQHAAPGLLDAVQQCVTLGKKTIVIVPFFLQMGMHVTADIPVLVEKARKRFPDIRIFLTDAVGSHPRMPEIVLDLAKKAQEDTAE
jgi:sirohydrochlorin ferrochelatase